MNKNKKVVKAMSSVLCASMLMGSVTPVFATTNETQTTSKETDSKDVEVTYNKSASYFVTIPKTITLDSNKESTYNVKVEGDIPSDKNVYVAPEDAISQTNEIDFYMHDQSTKHPKADVAAIVTQNKDTWDFEDVANGYEETTNKISASQLTAGNWKGTFNFNINLKDFENYGEDVTLTSDNLATYGIANTGDVVIPSVVTDSDGTKHKVTTIGVYAFYSCSGLTSITIPNSVTSIEEDAFEGCSNLTSIAIPNSVTSIGYRAFGGCTRLTSITIPDSVTSIENQAFIDCTGLTSITIPNSVTSIGGLVFRGCTNLTSITIPNSVTSIGDSAFADCVGLTSITIPDSVTSIETDAFCRCSGLTSITIPNSVTSIGYRAFGGCSGLTSITIPDSVTSTGNSVFKDCTELTSITYKGVNYTNKTDITNALTSNGVNVGYYTFDNTKLQ